jgi:hypothetical protein
MSRRERTTKARKVYLIVNEIVNMDSAEAGIL